MAEKKSSKNKNNSHNKKPFLFLVITLFGLAVIISAATIAYVAYHRDKIITDEFVESVQEKERFTFSDTEGWWQGATNNTSMVVFGEQNHNACFVSSEYYEGSVDEDVELKKISSNLKDFGDNYVLEKIDNKKLILQTTKDPVHLTLHQSKIIIPPGGTKLKTGQEFAYINLGNSHIKIRGYCDNPDQLDSTLDVIKSITYHYL